jgi:hypothetical protein
VKVDLRKPTPEDLERFKQCLALDADHKQQDADAWTSTPGEFMVFYDEMGNRVWVRLERCLRVSFQHDPETPRKVLAPLIYKSFVWLQGAARNSNYTEIIFESRAKRLILFLQKLFGVKPVMGNYHLRA